MNKTSSKIFDYKDPSGLPSPKGADFNLENSLNENNLLNSLDLKTSSINANNPTK